LLSLIANFESKRNPICGKAFLIEGGNRGQPYSVGEGWQSDNRVTLASGWTAIVW